MTCVLSRSLDYPVHPAVHAKHKLYHVRLFGGRNNAGELKQDFLNVCP
jgi:hypothetical protein